MKFRVLSYNLAMCPKILFWGCDYLEERTQELIGILKSQSHRFDILCFQEVFRESIREQLVDALAHVFPYIDNKSGEDELLDQDSGLFFASKYPIAREGKQKSFREFAHKKFLTADAFTDKGIFGVCLEMGTDKGKKLFIFNAHLQSTKAFASTREKQLDEVNRFIKKSIEAEIKRNTDPSSMAVLLLGDFNVEGDGSDEYQRMISLLGYPRDLYREMNSDPGYTWNWQENKYIQDHDSTDRDLQRLDYVFAFENVPVVDDNRMSQEIAHLQCLSCQLVKWKGREIHGFDGYDLSDHYGLVSEMNWED